ncbi:hypothetical protein MHU86_9177 [Fragilaria crotonensis]|nr:hypothetical protein MHU86_9177 [Fragilaria crotonensis]
MIKTGGNSRGGSSQFVPSLGFLALLVAHIVLPFASPFAVGTYASTTSATTNLGTSSALHHLRPPGVGASSGLAATSTAEEIQSSRQRKPLLTKVLTYLNRAGSPNASIAWKSGEYNATLVSKLLFSYASPLVDLASVRELEESDAFAIPKSHKMGSAVPELSDMYHKCRTKARRTIEQDRAKGGDDEAVASESGTLLQALILHQRRTLIVTGILRLANTAIQAFPALLIARLLRLVESGDRDPVRKSLLAVVALVGVLSVKMIIENQYFHRVVDMATQVRGSLGGLIFDKSLRLPTGGEGGKESRDSKTSLGDGGVLNLMQSDASVLESTAMQLHTIWDGPLQIIMYTSLLFRYLGPSVLWGIGVLLLVIPLNSTTLRILNSMRRFENEAKDARTKRTTEAISNMKLLKLQGWENSFADDINRYRREELVRRSSRGVIRALNQAISNAVPALVLVVTLMAYAKSGRPIVASTIFTAISLFNQLRFPLFFYPMLIDSLASGKSSLRRISSYLAAEEITPYVQSLESVDGGGAIAMKNGNFLWSSANPAVDGQSGHGAAPALCGVDISINPGEIVAVVGSVGSGKTALIKGLLGELSPVPSAVIDPSMKSKAETLGILEKPVVIAQGGIAYCSQEAWLPKGTLRDAVVFGREFDEARYRAALTDAGLDEDIDGSIYGMNSKEAASRGVLSHDTDVGEGGSNLSGGQRARVALARALYSGDDAKVYLLDDPLAALDAAVGSTVFERLTKRLRRSKSATLLVTNDPNIPRRCDRVALMGKYNPASPSCSTVIDIGTYDELLARGHDLRSLSSPEVPSKALDQDTFHDLLHDGEVIPLKVSNATYGYNQALGEFDNSTTLTQHADPDCVECMRGLENYIPDKIIPMTPDVEDEEYPILNSVLANHEISGAEENQVTAIPTSGTRFSLPPWFSFVTSNGAQFFQQYIVAKWTELGRGDALATALGGQYLSSLVKAAGIVSVFLWFRSFFTMRVGIEASDFLHNKMLTSVFKAPMSFFDSTPSGQLLSRFGKEMEIIDSAVPDGIGSVLFCFLQIGMSTAALAGVITPAMLLPLTVVGIFYSNTMGRFRPAARDLKRSESRTRSSLHSFW